MAYGTLTTLDTLAASQSSIVAYGEDRAFEEIASALAIHNRLTNEMLGTFVERTTDRLRRYGSTDSMAMDELDEFGSPDAQKIAAGASVGFPLRLYGIALQWTRKYMQNHTAAELAAQVVAAMDADTKVIYRQIRRTLFTPTNSTGYLDRLVDNVNIAVRALVNADSQPIPPGPYGDTFTASTHTHYLYTASTSLAAADLTGLVSTVREHYGTGQVEVYINAAQETAVRALTGFTAITPVFVTPATSAAAIVQEYNLIDPANRQIGYYGANYVPVWVKPWVPAGYLFAYVNGAPAPIALRERANGSGDFVLAYEDEDHPLRARAWEREFGMGIWERTNGAALYVDTGAAGAYVATTIS
jgi:hypothetical protein